MQPVKELATVGVSRLAAGGALSPAAAIKEVEANNHQQDTLILIQNVFQEIAQRLGNNEPQKPKTLAQSSEDLTQKTSMKEAAAVKLPLTKLKDGVKNYLATAGKEFLPCAKIFAPHEEKPGPAENIIKLLTESVSHLDKKSRDQARRVNIKLAYRLLALLDRVVTADTPTTKPTSGTSFPRETCVNELCQWIEDRLKLNYIEYFFSYLPLYLISKINSCLHRMIKYLV